MIESLYVSLLCLSAALLCYTGFQKYSLIRAISCCCSTCCVGLGFQHQNLQDFIKIIRALIKDIFLFVSGLAENVESQRAYAPLTPEQWTEFFNLHLKPGLEKVAYNPCHISNEDEWGIFRQFFTVGQHVWVRKGRKTVAQCCGRQ